MSVVSGEAVGEYMLTTEPGTQKVNIVALANDWDLSEVALTFTGTYMSTSGVADISLLVKNITGSYPICSTMRFTNDGMDAQSYSVSDNNPNGEVDEAFVLWHSMVYRDYNTMLTLLDSEGNVIAETILEDIFDDVIVSEG